MWEASGLLGPMRFTASGSESLSSSGSKQLCRQPWSLGPVRTSPGTYSPHLHGLVLGLALLFGGSPKSQATPCLVYYRADLGHSICSVNSGASFPAMPRSPTPLLPHTSGFRSPAFWSTWAHFQFSHPPESAASTTTNCVFIRASCSPLVSVTLPSYTVTNATDEQLTERKGFFWHYFMDVSSCHSQAFG